MILLYYPLFCIKLYPNILPAVNTYKDITHLLTLHLTCSSLRSTFRDSSLVDENFLAENIVSKIHITAHQTVTC